MNTMKKTALAMSAVLAIVSPVLALDLMVPVTDRAPSLIRFSADEWTDAARFGAFHVFRGGGVTESRPASFYLTATEDAIYYAIVSELPPDGKFVALSGRKEGVDAWQEDLAEFFFSGDMDPNAGVHYQVVVAPDGRRADYASTRGKSRAFPDWEKLVKVNLDRADGKWIVLARVDARIVGRKLTEGVWRIGATRDWQRPFRYSCSPSADFSAKDVRVRFVKGAPAVQFEFTKPPHDRKVIAGRMTVRNTSGELRTVKVLQRVTTDAMPETRIEKSLLLNPGEMQEVPVETGFVSISNLEYGYESLVTDGTGETVYAQKYDWRKPFDAPSWDVSDKVEAPVDFMFAFYPSLSRLRLTTVVRATKDVPESVTYVVRSLKDGQEMARASFPTKDGDERILDLPELDGDYVIEQQAGKAVEKKTFERHRFVWEGNSLGKSRKVYLPFKPITVERVEKAEGVERPCLMTVLREHTLGANGLPAQIKADGQDLLVAPAHLIADGRPVEAYLSFDERADDRVVTTSDMKSGDFVAMARATWEYDGCLKYELTLQKGTVKTLDLEIPFRGDVARNVHAVGQMRQTDALTLERRDGIVWEAKNLKPAVCANFANYVFVGNPFRGLSFWAENDKGWSWDRATSNADIVRRGDAVILRIHLVNRPLTVSEPRTLTLGFQAGPVKPRVAGWRTFRDKYRGLFTDVQWIGGPGDCGSHAPFNKDIRFFEHIRKSFVPGQPQPTEAEKKYLKDEIRRVMADYQEPDWGEALCKAVDRVASFWSPKGYDRKPLFYYNRSVWNHLEEFRTFMNEWSGEDFCKRGEKPSTHEVNVTPYGTFLDFVIYYYKLSIDYGNGGVYCDNYYLRPTWNRFYDQVYRDPDGSIVPAAAIWSLREHAKRIFVMMNETGITQPLYMPHMTTTQVLPLMSFAQVQLDWEWKFSTGPVQTRFTPEYLQLVSWGHIVGTVPEVLGERGVQSGDPLVERTYRAVELLHELYQPVYQPKKEPAWLQRFIDSYAPQNDLVVHRYFDEGVLPVSVSSPEVKWITYTNRDGQTLAFFVSYSDRPVTCSVSFDSSLGLTGRKGADVESGRVFAGELVFDKGYEAIGVEFK